MNGFVVYMHISPKGKKYIGITSMKPEHRWNGGKGYVKNKYFYDAILKYGWDNFQHIIIADRLPKEKACELEKALIAGCKSTDPSKGYNMSLGGESGTYGIRFGPEFGESVRKRMLGPLNTNYGKKFSDETRRKLSDVRKGKWSPKQKEALTKVHESMRKKIICLDTGTIYESQTQAALKTGCSQRGIQAVCKGEQISAHGLHFAHYTGQSEQELAQLLEELIRKKEMVYKVRKVWNKGKRCKQVKDYE